MVYYVVDYVVAFAPALVGYVDSADELGGEVADGLLEGSGCRVRKSIWMAQGGEERTRAVMVHRRAIPEGGAEMDIRAPQATVLRRVDYGTNGLIGLPLLVEDARVCATPRDGLRRPESANPGHAGVPRFVRPGEPWHSTRFSSNAPLLDHGCGRAPTTGACIGWRTEAGRVAEAPLRVRSGSAGVCGPRPLLPCRDPHRLPDRRRLPGFLR